MRDQNRRRESKTGAQRRLLWHHNFWMLMSERWEGSALLAPNLLLGLWLVAENTLVTACVIPVSGVAPGKASSSGVTLSPLSRCSHPQTVSFLTCEIKSSYWVTVCLYNAGVCQLPRALDCRVLASFLDAEFHAEVLSRPLPLLRSCC